MKQRGSEEDSNGTLAAIARKTARLGRILLYGETLPFLWPGAININKARLNHLVSLNLNLSKKSVLEVGTGIGLLTKFFEDRGCSVLSTDGNPRNVKEIQRRYLRRKVEVLDLDKTSSLSKLGRFDIVFCYGTLYHLSRPEQALKAISEICREMILLETCVALGSYAELHFVRDPAGRDQAVSGVGCRPTRLWVMETLRKHFGYAYITNTQPRHRDFPLDWHVLPTQLVYRAVFVGSKHPLDNPNLLEKIPDQQQAQ